MENQATMVVLECSDNKQLSLLVGLIGDNNEGIKIRSIQIHEVIDQNSNKDFDKKSRPYDKNENHKWAKTYFDKVKSAMRINEIYYGDDTKLSEKLRIPKNKNSNDFLSNKSITMILAFMVRDGVIHKVSTGKFQRKS